MMITSVLMAFALVLIIEGLGPLLFPNKWRLYVLQLAKLPIKNIQQVGAVLVIIGALWLLFLQL